MGGAGTAAGPLGPCGDTLSSTIAGYEGPTFYYSGVGYLLFGKIRFPL